MKDQGLPGSSDECHEGKVPAL